MSVPRPSTGLSSLTWPVDEAGQARAEAVAPVRQLRRVRPLAAEHRVRGARRRAAELRGRDPARRGTRSPPPRRSPRRTRPRCTRRRRRRARRRARQLDEPAHRRRQMPDVGRAAALVVDDGDLVALARRAAASCARSCARSARRATTSGRSSASSPAAPSPCSFVRPYAESGLGRVRLDVRLALRPVEDVVASSTRRAARRARPTCRVPPTFTAAAPCGSPSAPSTSVHAAAWSTRSGRAEQRQRGGNVTSQSARVNAITSSAANSSASARAELPAGARDQDAAAASRADRIGDRVLQRSTTRGSSHGTPCSSGSAGSYSSVTW